MRNLCNLRSKLFYLLLGLIAINHSLPAQSTFTNNGAAITLNPGGSLHIFGDLENKSTGMFDNDGTIVLNGDIQNNAVTNLTTAASGVFILNSSNPLSISGISDIYFYDFELNNSSINGMTLGTNIDVANNLLMTDGDIDLAGWRIDLGSTGLLVGETNNNRIYGLSGTINATRDLNAPNNQNIAGLGMEITSLSNLGITQISRGHTIQTASNGNSSIERYYDITPTNNNALDATLTFNYFDKEIVGHNEAALILWRSVDSGINWEGWDGNINTANNYIERQNIDEMYRWTLSDVDDRPLPVELVYFTAVANDREEVELDWETEVEINNDFFIVQRSRNGTMFFDIGRVQSVGDTQENIHYDFLDNNPYMGHSYYRLMIVDNDGSYVYSEIRSVFIGEDQINVFPNPILKNQDLHLIGLNSGVYEMTLYDASGKLIFIKAISSTSIFEEHQLTIPKLSGGTYAYILSSNSKPLKSSTLIVINSEN